MFPLIPLLAAIAVVGGGGTLLWYSELPEEKQQEADRIACGYAKEIFGKSLKQLTKEQADQVATLTERHFSA